MNNYDEKIAEERKKSEKYLYLFKLAIDKMEFKNARQEKNILKLYQSLVNQPTYEGKKKIKGKILSAFQSLKKQEDVVSSVKLQYLIEENFQKKHIKERLPEIVKLSIELSQDLKKAATNYLNEYLSCYWRIQLIEQEKQDALNASKAPKKMEPSYKPTPTPAIEVEYEEPRSRYGIPLPREPKPTLYSSKYISSAEQQTQINESLIALANNQAPAYNRGLTSKQKEEVRDVYNGQNKYVFADIVSDAIEMNQIANEYSQMNKVTKKLPNGIDPRVNDIMRLAINCYNITIYQMENSDGFGKDYETKANSRVLLQKLNIFNTLGIYRETYETFMKYYNSLSEAEKETIKFHIKKYGYEYKKIFNISEEYPRIVTVKDITNAINATMSDKISLEFRRADSKDIGYEFSQYLISSTRFMTVDEVVSLYKRIKYEMINNHQNYGQNDREKEAIENEYNRKLELLQDEFIHVIKKKIHFNVDYDPKAPKEEQDRAIRLMSVQSGMIARDFFDEDLLFNPYNLSEVEIPKGKAKIKGELVKEATSAEERFFGMSKFKKAMSTATGSYKKLQELIEKQYVTEQDVAYVKKLF